MRKLIIPMLQRGNTTLDAPASATQQNICCLGTIKKVQNVNCGLINRNAGASRAAFPRWSVGTINHDNETKKRLVDTLCLQAFFYILAERTGLEPATSGVTGRHSNQLNYRSRKYCLIPTHLHLVVVGDTGLEPVTLGL